MPTEIVKISNDALKLEFVSYFEQGITSKTNIYELIRTRYKMGKQRCLNMYDIVHAEWVTLRQAAQNGQLQANAVEGLKSGLKTKLERQLERQQLVEDIISKIEGRAQHFYLNAKGAICKTIQADGSVIIPSHVLKDLHYILDIHQTSLEKTEGDIVTKIAATDPKGNTAVKPYTDAQVEKILEALDKK